MNKRYILRKDEPGGELYGRIHFLVRNNGWTRQSIGATLGVVGGTLSIILGALSWMVVYMLAPGRFESFLNTAEVVLFAFSLPLLALGACCLDLLEKSSPLLSLSTHSRFVCFERLVRLRPQQPDKN